jgi:hypothetical protein
MLNRLLLEAFDRLLKRLRDSDVIFGGAVVLLTGKALLPSKRCRFSKSQITKLSLLSLFSPPIFFSMTKFPKRLSLSPFCLPVRNLCPTAVSNFATNAGDARQVPPVTLLNGKAHVINAHFTSSYLLPLLQRLELTENMRMRNSEASADTIQFLQELEDIGDGRTPVGDDGLISLPACVQPAASAAELCRKVYGDLFDNRVPPERLSEYLRERTIVTPLLRDCRMLNDLIISQTPGPVFTYKSADSWDNSDTSMQEQQLDEATLNSLDLPGLPPHELTFTHATTLILLRNISTNRTSLPTANLSTPTAPVHCLIGPLPTPAK